MIERGCPIDDSGSCCGLCPVNGRSGYRVIAVLPVFGRLPLLKLTIERLYKKNGVNLVICVGGTEEEKTCVDAGAEFIHHNNKPLGRKWNAGFQAAKKYNPDACLFVGSSDWISDNWLTEMEPHIENFDLIGTAGCYFLDIAQKFRLVYWPGYKGVREGESIGIGRLISKRVLDKINWKPFDDLKDGSLDYSMVKSVEKVGGKSFIVDNEKIESVSISTDKWPNKHSFDQHWTGVLKSEKIKDTDEFIDKHFPEAKKVF